MKLWNKEKLVTILFLLIIYSICTGLMLSIIFKVLGQDNTIEERPKLKIDYEKAYPFAIAENDSIESIKSEVNNEETALEQVVLKQEAGANATDNFLVDAIKKLEAKLDVYINKIDTYSYAHVPFRSEWINIYGTLNKCKGDVIIDSEILIVKLENDKLSYVYPTLNSNGQEEYISAFGGKLEEQGIDFLYVNCPFKINKKNKSLPWAVEDNTNEGINIFLDKLKEKKVEVLDLREKMDEQNLNHYDMFYVTDHHWTTESGFWAAGQVAEYMNENWNYDFRMEYLQEENYNKQVYPEWYAGSQGKKTGIGYVKADDFVLLTPQFETEFEIEIKTRNYSNKGSFEETLYDYSQVQQKNYYLYNLYNGYLYDDNPLTQIHNLKVNNGKRILILKDSFALTVVPFLAAAEGAEYVDIVDLRWFTGSLETFMQKNKPDSVMMIYNPGMLDYREYKDNHSNPWNLE